MHYRRLLLFASHLAPFFPTHICIYYQYNITIKKIFLFPPMSGQLFYHDNDFFLHAPCIPICRYIPETNSHDFIGFQYYIGRHNDSIKLDSQWLPYNLANKSRPRNPIRVWSPVSIILIYRFRCISVYVLSHYRSRQYTCAHLFVSETKLMADRNYSYIRHFIKIERERERGLPRRRDDWPPPINAIFPVVRNSTRLSSLDTRAINDVSFISALYPWTKREAALILSLIKWVLPSAAFSPKQNKRAHWPILSIYSHIRRSHSTTQMHFDCTHSNCPNCPEISITMHRDLFSSRTRERGLFVVMSLVDRIFAKRLIDSLNDDMAFSLYH